MDAGVFVSMDSVSAAARARSWMQRSRLLSVWPFTRHPTHDWSLLRSTSPTELSDNQHLPKPLDERRDTDLHMSSILDKPTAAPPQSTIHVAFFIAQWIALSSAIILFNKYILTKTDFTYPILLASWHMTFATLMTQTLARCTKLLDSRLDASMTPRAYARIVLPIGFLFSMCLVCGNIAYLYLTVSFIQMLKASMPIITIFVSWVMGRTPFSLRALGNAAFIGLGVIIASYGELHFVLIGVLIQISSVVFDALRLVLTQQLLTTSMDPLVLLYYLSPLCAVTNTLMACFGELPRLSWADVQSAGYFTLLMSACVAFALNMATVTLISKTTSLSMTLCGILKNILIVLASMLIFRDPVSLLQGIGYSIALSGLLYYQLGSDNAAVNIEAVKDLVHRGARKWEEMGYYRSPARFWLTVVGSVALVLVGLLGMLALTGAVPLSFFYTKFAAANMFGAVDPDEFERIKNLHPPRS